MKGNGAILLLILSAFLIVIHHGCSQSAIKEEQGKELIVGVKIYDYSGDLGQLFIEWRGLGINTAYVSPDFCARGRFRELARENGLAVYLIIPVFYNPEELQKYPSFYAVTDAGEKAQDDWVQFICPTREEYRKRRIEYIKELIQDLDPDGLSLDFIRYFVFWEMVYPDRTLDSLPNTCFDEHCLKKFQEETGIAIPKNLKSIPEKARWIKKHHLQAWTEWKCRIITSMVKTASREARKLKPDISINIHLVPWREHDYSEAYRIIAGQDLTALSPYVDYLSPMCYAHMLKRKPPWISSVVQDMYRRTRGKIIPSIQVKEAYLPEKLTAEEFKLSLTASLKTPSAGVVFWSWDHFEQDPEKKEVVKKIVKEAKSNESF
ncbi:MAG: hypothetical protein ACETWK_12715 [Candidatus Aminicenantaceae bacterium]